MGVAEGEDFDSLVGQVMEHKERLWEMAQQIPVVVLVRQMMVLDQTLVAQEL